MTISIGVDVGLSGAIAAVCSQRGLLEHENLPTCDNGAGRSASIREVIWLTCRTEIVSCSSPDIPS